MEEEIKEKSLQRVNAESLLVVEAVTPFAELDDEVKLAISCASEKKAFDIVAIDLREIASFTEFFIIASGTNMRQVQAISDEITEKLKEQLNSRVIRIEGYQTGEWILLDYGDFIVHIFEQKAREFYDLERLWRDAKKVQLPEEIF
ncbi:MAG: ribosome silencing factor [Acidobacteria bacterium]|nr:ribosome silencing factor [Acidobacteriota bacterium]